MPTVPELPDDGTLIERGKPNPTLPFLEDAVYRDDWTGIWPSRAGAATTSPEDVKSPEVVANLDSLGWGQELCQHIFDRSGCRSERH